MPFIFGPVVADSRSTSPLKLKVDASDDAGRPCSQRHDGNDNGAYESTGMLLSTKTISNLKTKLELSEITDFIVVVERVVG